MTFLKKFIICLGIAVTWLSFFQNNTTYANSPYIPDWIEKKVDDYHKSDNKLAGLLGLIYSLGGIVVFFAYIPQFLGQVRKNRQISSATFSLFGTVNTIGLAYAITSGTTPLMVTMFPATFWCWLMVSTNEIKKRRWDFSITVDRVLGDLSKVMDTGNEDHLNALKKHLPDVFTDQERVMALGRKLQDSTRFIDEFIQMYNCIVQDTRKDIWLREKMWHYLDGLSFPAAEYGIDGKPIFLNQAFINITEYSRYELFHAENIAKLLYKWENYEEVLRALSNIKQNGEGYSRRVFTLTTKSGKHRSIYWTTQPAKNEEGSVVGTIRFGIDMELELDERLDAISGSI